MTERRLRVAVPADLFAGETTGGRGRMWHEVLLRLDRSCELQAMHGGRRAQWRQRRWGAPDAWLFDGHLGPLPVDEPQVIQLHEAPWNEAETVRTLEADFLEKVVEPSRRAARAASAIVCPSESARQQIVADSGVPAERVVAAHHGVDHDVFRPGLTGGSALVARHGGDPERPFVVSVSSLHPRKNLMALREGFNQLVGEGLPHQLVIVGGPAHARSDADALIAATFAPLPAAPGRMVSIPFGISDPELAALMCDASAFCLPSFSEGFGLPAAEAMACGTPSVLSRRGALIEVGADAAVMVEPDPASIADGLRSVLADADAAQAVGKACEQRARAFSWDRCAELWFGALQMGVAAGVGAP